MKKSLISLAVLGAMAVAGSALAEGPSYSMTGSVGLGLTKGPTKDNATTATVKEGAATFGVTDAGVTLQAVEKLDGGMTATGEIKLGMDAGLRSGAVGAKDRSVTVGGGFGAVKLAHYESCNNAGAADISGASLSQGLDGENGPVKGCGNVAGVIYSSPELAPGLKVGVSYTHAETKTTENAAPSISATYNKDGIYARFAYKNIGSDFDKADSKIGASSINLDGSYDAGVVKVALGYYQEVTKQYVAATGTAAATTADTVYSKDPTIVLGVSVPFMDNKDSIGLAYATRGKANGFVLGYNHAFGANTALNVSYGAAANVAGTTGDASSDGIDAQYRIKLVQSF